MKMFDAYTIVQPILEEREKKNNKKRRLFRLKELFRSLSLYRARFVSMCRLLDRQMKTYGSEMPKLNSYSSKENAFSGKRKRRVSCGQKKAEVSKRKCTMENNVLKKDVNEILPKSNHEPQNSVFDISSDNNAEVGKCVRSCDPVANDELDIFKVNDNEIYPCYLEYIKKSQPYRDKNISPLNKRSSSNNDTNASVGHLESVFCQDTGFTRYIVRSKKEVGVEGVERVESSPRICQMKKFAYSLLQPILEEMGKKNNRTRKFFMMTEMIWSLTLRILYTCELIEREKKKHFIETPKLNSYSSKTNTFSGKRKRRVSCGQKKAEVSKRKSAMEKNVLKKDVNEILPKSNHEPQNSVFDMSSDNNAEVGKCVKSCDHVANDEYIKNLEYIKKSQPYQDKNISSLNKRSSSNNDTNASVSHLGSVFCQDTGFTRCIVRSKKEVSVEGVKRVESSSRSCQITELDTYDILKPILKEREQNKNNIKISRQKEIVEMSRFASRHYRIGICTAYNHVLRWMSSKNNKMSSKNNKASIKSTKRKYYSSMKNIYPGQQGKKICCYQEMAEVPEGKCIVEENILMKLSNRILPEISRGPQSSASEISSENSTEVGKCVRPCDPVANKELEIIKVKNNERLPCHLKCIKKIQPLLDENISSLNKNSLSNNETTAAVGHLEPPIFQGTGAVCPNKSTGYSFSACNNNEKVEEKSTTIPSVESFNLTDENQFIDMPKTDCNQKRKQKLSPIFMIARKIKCSVIYPIKNLIMIWSPNRTKYDPDFVKTNLIRAIGRDYDVQDRWKVPPSFENSRWIGCVAGFKKEVNVAEAEKRIESSCRYLKLLSLEKLVEIYADEEGKHPKFISEARQVLITSKKCLNDPLTLKTVLSSIGIIEKICFPLFDEAISTHLKPQVICVVTYKFMTHAVAAQLVLHEHYFRSLKVGRLKVFIRKTVEGVDFTRTVQDLLQSYHFCDGFRLLNDFVNFN